MISEKDLLEIIISVDTQEKFFGIVPLFAIYQHITSKTDSNLSIEDFHSLILQMEKKDKIYLETINDVNRLNIDEKKTAIYDQVRGYLYYVGRW